MDWKAIWTGGAAGALAGAAATVLVGYFGFVNKDRELDIKMVEVSLSILAGENDATKSLPAKRFALRTLEKFSNVDIPDDDFDDWVAGERIDLATGFPFWLRSGGAYRIVPSSEDGIVPFSIETIPSEAAETEQPTD